MIYFTWSKCYLLKVFSLSFVSKVEADLPIISLESVKVGPRSFVAELVVNFLIEHNNSAIHVEDPNEVGSSRIVLDEASNSATTFVPPKIKKKFPKFCY